MIEARSSWMLNGFRNVSRPVRMLMYTLTSRKNHLYRESSTVATQRRKGQPCDDGTDDLLMSVGNPAGNEPLYCYFEYG